MGVICIVLGRLEVANVMSGTEINGFLCCFGFQSRRKFGLGSSRTLNRFWVSIYGTFLVNLLSKMKAARRQHIALLSGKLNVFAHRELFKTV